MACRCGLLASRGQGEPSSPRQRPSPSQLVRYDVSSSGKLVMRCIRVVVVVHHHSLYYHGTRPRSVMAGTVVLGGAGWEVPSLCSRVLADKVHWSSHLCSMWCFQIAQVRVIMGVVVFFGHEVGYLQLQQPLHHAHAESSVSLCVQFPKYALSWDLQWRSKINDRLQTLPASVQISQPM